VLTGPNGVGKNLVIIELHGYLELALVNKCDDIVHDIYQFLSQLDSSVQPFIFVDDAHKISQYWGNCLLNELINKQSLRDPISKLTVSLSKVIFFMTMNHQILENIPNTQINGTTADSNMKNHELFPQLDQLRVKKSVNDPVVLMKTESWLADMTHDSLLDQLISHHLTSDGIEAQIFLFHCIIVPLFKFDRTASEAWFTSHLEKINELLHR